MSQPSRAISITFVWLALIVLMYLFLGWSYTHQTPDWQIPDEPAHYNYIQQIVQTGEIPVIEVGDWDTEYQELLKSTKFDPQYIGGISRIQYEDHQPPLYYLLGSLFYRLGDGDLTTIRLLSVILGLGTVLTAFFTVNSLFPEKPWLGLATAAFVAFIPQHLAMLGGINNDSLAELLVGLALLATVQYLQTPDPDWRDSLRLGVLVGLAFLTKSTIYFLAGVAGIAILLRWRRARWTFSQAVPHLTAYLVPALLMGSVWWIHNIDVYGGTDFLGLERHDVVAGEQLRTEAYINRDLGGDGGLYRKNYAYTTFHSFWGQFGWMALPMETRIYRILLLLCTGILAGSILYIRQEKWIRSLLPYQAESLILFALTLVLVAAAYMFYNLTFVQFQGRYLYPALIPLSFWGAIGLAGWVLLIQKRLPNRVSVSSIAYIIVPIAMLLAVLSWYALNTYIVPNL